MLNFTIIISNHEAQELMSVAGVLQINEGRARSIVKGGKTKHKETIL